MTDTDDDRLCAKLTGRERLRFENYVALMAKVKPEDTHRLASAIFDMGYRHGYDTRADMAWD